MTRNKSLFTASFDMGLSQTLTGRGYDSLTRFTHWLGKFSVWRSVSRLPLCAILSTVLITNPGCMKPRRARKRLKCV